MRTVEARLSRKKRPFDMPASDGMAQFLVPGAQLAELLQPLDQLRPFIGDESKEEATTGGRAQRLRRDQRFLDRQIVALKIDAGVTVHLQIDQRGSEPNIVFRWIGRSHEMSDDSLPPTDADSLPCPVMPGPNLSVVHGAISVASSTDCKRFGARKSL